MIEKDPDEGRKTVRCAGSCRRRYVYTTNGTLPVTKNLEKILEEVLR